MRVLLIAPPFYRFIGYYNRYFPMGLGYLASVLKQNGHDVVIYDADANKNPTKMNYASLEENYPEYLKALNEDSHPIWEEVRSVVIENKPDIIGISAYTTFIASAFKIAAICKKLHQSIPVIMGGPHISIKCEEVMDVCKDIDIAVKGEGEATLLELVELLNKADNRNKILRSVKGISYRDDGQVIHNPARSFIKDINHLPFPARDLLVNKDCYDSEDMGLLMASRGCPYSCTYCAIGMWGRKVRCRSVENILEEIKVVISTYGTRQFTFKDDSFTISRKRIVEFCQEVHARKLKFVWDCNSRVNLVDEELLKLMKRAGCNSIKVGIESGSERILRLMRKNITLEQCRNAARMFRKVGIFWTGYFMMGLPTETKVDIYQTLGFMKELRPDYASLSVYESFPGTELHQVGIEKKLVNDKRTLKDFFSISPKYYYVNNIMRRIDTMDNDTLQKLEAEIKMEFHSYNTNFKRLAMRALSRRGVYLNEPQLLVRDFKKFLAWLR